MPIISVEIMKIKDEREKQRTTNEGFEGLFLIWCERLPIFGNLK